MRKKHRDRSTRNNKIMALLFIGISALGMILTRDGTAFVFSLMVGVPLFFSKENWIR